MREKILAKLQKLLALANCKNGLGDTEAAMEAASRLMLKHQIEECEINFDNQDQDPEDLIIIQNLLPENQKTYTSWQFVLLCGLARANSCRTVKTASRHHGPAGKLQVVGHEQDVAAVKYLFSYCINEINRLANEFEQEHKWEYRKDKIKTVKTSFRTGAASAISQKARAARENAKREFSACRALVLVDKRESDVEEELGNLFPNLKQASPVTIASQRAYSAGREAGQTVRLSGGIGLGAGKESPRALNGGN